MDIKRSSQKVTVVEAQGLSVRSAEQMTLSFVFPVEARGIFRKQVPHGIIKGRFLWAEQQMEVVWHETKSIHFERVFFGDVLHERQHGQIVGVFQKQGFFPGCPLGDMRNQIGHIELLFRSKKASNPAFYDQVQRVHGSTKNRDMHISYSPKTALSTKG